MNILSHKEPNCLIADNKGTTYNDYNLKELDLVFNKAFLNVENLCKSLNISFRELFRIQLQINKLHKEGKFIKSLTFSDLDDTLLSRLTQLEEDKFAKNRGPEGNKVLYNMGISNFCSKYCKPYMLVNTIAKNIDVILSAGNSDIQGAKLGSLGVKFNKVIVVDSHDLKPKTMLYYLLFDLKVIPGEIIFYDDRMKELLDSFKYMSDLLGNNFTLNEVELDPTNPNTIKNIEMTKYKSGEEHKPLSDSLDELMKY